MAKSCLTFVNTTCRTAPCLSLHGSVRRTCGRTSFQSLDTSASRLGGFRFNGSRQKISTSSRQPTSSARVRGEARCFASIAPLKVQNSQVDLNYLDLQYYAQNGSPQLVSREAELRAVLSELGRRGCAVVSGGPGQGKSALAFKAGSLLWETPELPGGAFRIDLAAAGELDRGATIATSTGTADLDLSRVAQSVALQIIAQLQASEDAPSLNAKPTWSAVEQWLRKLDHHGQMALVIFENAESVMHDKKALEDFKQLLQILNELPSIKLLVTSRASSTFGVAAVTHLTPLPKPAAMHLLASACDANVDWEVQAGADVVALCSGNSQLLMVIAGIVSAGRCSLQDAFEWIAEDDLPSTMPVQLSAAAGHKKPITLLASWLAAFLLPDEQQGVVRLSLFPGSFSQQAAAAAMNFATADSVVPADAAVSHLLSQLCKLSIVQAARPATPSSSGRYTMPALIREAAVLLMHELPDAEQDAARCAFVQAMLPVAGEMAGLLPDSSCIGTAVQRVAEELSNFRQASALLASSPLLGAICGSAEVVGFLSLTADVLAVCGQHAEVEQLRRQLLELQEAVLGSEHVDALSCMNDLSSALRASGKHPEAAQLDEQNLEVMQRVLGVDHPQTQLAMSNIAWGLQQIQDWDTLADSARQQLGVQHPSALEGLAELVCTVSAVDDLRYSFTTSFDVWKVLGDKGFQALCSVNKQAADLQAAGRDEEAADLHEERLQLLQPVLVSSDPSAKKLWDRVAEIRHGKLAREQRARAMDLLEQVVVSRQATLGPVHHQTLDSLGDLAAALQASAQYDRAVQNFREVMHARQRILGLDDARTLDSMEKTAKSLLARAFATPGPPPTPCYDDYEYDVAYADDDEAEQLHRQVLHIRRRRFGDDHADTLRSMFNLAKQLQFNRLFSEDWPEAAGLYHTMVSTMQDRLGSKHPALLDPLGQLAKLHEQQACAAHLSRDERGESDPTVSSPDSHWQNVKRVQRKMAEIELVGDSFSSKRPDPSGQHAAAVRHCRRDLKLKQQLYGPSDSQSLASMQRLVTALRQAGQHTHVVNLLRQMHIIQGQVLGYGHPDTICSDVQLANQLRCTNSNKGLVA